MQAIKDISEILNFRYKERHVLELIDGVPCSEKYTSLEVFINFKLGFFRDEPRRAAKQQFNNESHNIYCDVCNGFQDLIPFLEKNNSQFESLVCAGDDQHLSKNIKYLQKFKHRFNKIYYEAKDMECDWVQTIPMGMIMRYMIRNGGNDVILPQINKKKNKTKLIASAFGSLYPHLTERISDRSELKNFTSNCDFMDNMFCEPIKFYENLCDYRFFACPLGNGIQTPKICECIMCETIPVVTDHVAHRELRDIYDLPLLIVNEWTDLSEGFLVNQWNEVYSKVDWGEQKSKFLVKNFNRFLM